MEKLLDKTAAEVLALWRQTSNALALFDLDKFEFEEVLIPKPQPHLADEILDWWPRCDFQGRRQVLEEHGPFAVYWTTKKGTERTAQLLWKARTNADHRAMVLLSAALWDLTNPALEAWYGVPVRLAHEVLASLHEVLWAHKIGTWHHRCRDALPCSITHDYEAAEALRPSDLRSLLLVASLNVAMTRATWAPVVIRKSDPGVRLVDAPGST